MIRIFALSLFLLSIAFTAYADPNITSVSGTVSDGNTVTITGSGFGSGNSTPTVFDDFDTGSFKSYWSATGNGALTTANQRHARSTYNYHNNFRSTHRNGDLTGNGSPTASRWFVQYWFYLDNNFDFGTTTYDGSDRFLSNIKTFRLWNPSSSINENFVFAVNGFINNLIYNMENTGDNKVTYNGLSTVAPKGQWVLWQFEYAENSGLGNADGVIKWYINGNLQSQRNDMVTRQDFSQNKRPFIIGWDAVWGTGPGESDDAPNDFYMDDAYADTTWSRVEVCPNSTWANRGQCEIQPKTSHATGEIAIKFNQGRFGNAEQVFFYVVDNLGVANSNGYQVIIGGAASDTQEPQLLSSNPASGDTGIATSHNQDLTISDNVSLDNSTFVAIERVNSGSPSNVTANFTKLSSSQTQTVWRRTGVSNSNSDTVDLNVLIDDNSANSLDTTISYTIVTAPPDPASPIFSSGDTGTQNNYTEKTPSRWDTFNESGNVVYELFTTDYDDSTNEITYFDTQQFTNFEIELKIRSNDNLATNGFADCGIALATQDSNNYYWMEISNFQGQSNLHEVANGGITNYIAWVDGTDLITDNNFHTFRLRQQNGQLTLHRDETQITFGALGSSVPLTQTNGYIGFGSDNDSCTFDDVVITNLGGGQSPDPTPSPEPTKTMQIRAINSLRMETTKRSGQRMEITL